MSNKAPVIEAVQGARGLTFEDIQEHRVRCTGCGACAAACGQKAIQMKRDNEGFLYPTLSKDRCVLCGQCYAVCPLSEEIPDTVPIKTLFAYAIDEEKRFLGSSGGIIGLLSEKIVSDGGVVFGAVMDAGEKKVKHSSSDVYSLKELSKSKYVQSDLEDVFSEVKQNLKKNRKVMFCGTPCQVMGLKRYLQREYTNLLTVDFFCHGVPSPGLFEDMIRDEEKGIHSEIKDVVFREKIHGWREHHMQFVFPEVTSTVRSKEYYYYYYFIKNYSLRKSCYGCEAYRKHRADITVADYWHIEKDLDDDKGVSIVCIHTKTGEKAYTDIRDALMDRNICLNLGRYQHHYRMKARDRFFSAYEQGGLSYIKGPYYRRRKRIDKVRAKWERYSGVLKGIIRKYIKR